MISSPKISVLIANYNNAHYLMEAVESVRQQSYTEWEIVLVDDGSTDESCELYKQLEVDDRIHIYYNGENKGCAYTKHQCVLHASGKYCGYLDPDDVLLPDALRVTEEALENNPDAVMTMSRFYRCDMNLNILSESRLLHLKDGESYLEHHDYRPEVFAGFSREAYLKSGGLDVSMKAGVDQDLYFRVEEQGRIVVVDAFTYKYRTNPEALTSDPMWCEYWNIIARHNACVRRGLNIKEFAYKDWLTILSWKSEEYADRTVRKTKAYQLGAMLLKPFKHR